eukprot:10562026-Karenia_brevis.AAC.1
MASHVLAVHVCMCYLPRSAYTRLRPREFSVMKIGLADERHLHANGGSNCMRSGQYFHSGFLNLPDKSS